MNVKKTLEKMKILNIILLASFLLLSSGIHAQTVTYLWSNGATTPSIDVNPSETTTYYVTITQNGVEYIDSLVVSIEQTAAATINGENSICLGSSTMLQASSGVSYIWNTGETTSAIEVSPEINTTYSVDVFDTNGCVSSATQNITISPNPSVSFLPNNTTYCNNSGSVELSGGSPSGGVYSGPGVSNGEFNPATAGGGLHPITYTYTNANGCSGSETVAYEVAVCTGVEAEKETLLKITPNPAFGDVYLQLTGNSAGTQPVALYLTDASGRVVLKSQVQASELQKGYLLDLSRFANGYYLITLQGEHLFLNSRLVKHTF
jgi:hypothetical protein